MNRILEFIKTNIKPLVIGGVVALVVVFGIIGGERVLSSKAFCLSCHSMSYPYEELKDSSHYGTIGIDPECKDCHLPPNFLLRVESHIVDGTRAIIGEFKHDLSTKEEFDKHRAEYAHNARINIRKWDSSPCRVCHKHPRPSSEDAERQHKKLETGEATCIDCHQNLVHEEVPEEDIVAGMKAGRIVPRETAEEEEEEE